MRGVFALASLAAGVVIVCPFVLDLYTLNILSRSFLFAILALTVDVLWGISGFLTFGQSAFFGAGAYAAALGFTQYGYSTAIGAASLAVAVLAASVMAALQGWLSFYYGATALYASVVSLAVPVVATQILFSGGTFTGSSSGLTGYDTPDLSIAGWVTLSGLLLVALTTAAFVLVRSDAGRVLVALRENESRCAYLGLNTAQIRIAVLIASAAVAGVAGWLYACSSGVVAPELAGFVFGTEIVIWVALGGRGTLIGPVIGAVLIDLVSAYLSGSLPFLWKLLLGLAFIAVIVWLPRGLIPALASPIGRLLARGERTPPLLVPDSAPLRARAAGPALELTGVRKSFGALPVLTDINLTATASELVSLVGPNGAGKTTLMRCLSDGAERSGGAIWLNGHDIGFLPPHRCVAFGLGRKFQTANVFDTLDVAESLRIARAHHRRPSFWRRAETLALPPAALRVLTATGLDEMLDREVRLLSHGQKQSLELAMVLALDPAIILLDEPTAGLTRDERSRIGAILSDLARIDGLCLLLVEHDLDFVREISSRVVVLHQGRIVLDGTVEDVAASELVRTIYTGDPH